MTVLKTNMQEINALATLNPQIIIKTWPRREREREKKTSSRNIAICSEPKLAYLKWAEVESNFGLKSRRTIQLLVHNS